MKLDIMEYSDLRDKVLRGYAYRIGGSDRPVVEGERRVMLQTGRGGVLVYLAQCESGGLPAELAGDDIQVLLEDGWHRIMELSVVDRK